VPRPRIVELYLHNPICLHKIKHKDNFVCPLFMFTVSVRKDRIMLEPMTHVFRNRVRKIYQGWIHGRDSSAGIVTSFRLDGPGSIFRYF
jgi:hypothetical protein